MNLRGVLFARQSPSSLAINPLDNRLFFRDHLANRQQTASIEQSDQSVTLIRNRIKSSIRTQLLDRHADLCQDPDRQDHHAGGGVL